MMKLTNIIAVMLLGALVLPFFWAPLVMADSINFQVTVVKTDFSGWANVRVEVWNDTTLLAAENTNSDGDVFFCLGEGGPYEFRTGDASTMASVSGISDAVLVGVILMPTVVKVNQPPVAVNDSYSTNEDAPLTTGAPGVLANDTDPDNDPLTAVLISGPSHGTLTLNADGSFTYTPNLNYNGIDSFTYKANDAELDSNVATVNITVNPVNDAPVLAPISGKTVNEGELLSFTISATDPDGDALTYSASNLPSGANFDAGSRTFSWTLGYDQAGTYADVHFEVTDGDLTDSETITITVNEVNKADPVITWDNPADIVYGTLLNGTQLNATASVPGTFVYTPAAGTKLNAGSGQTLHVNFTPTDTTNYNNVSKDVKINVLKASATVTLSNLNQTYNGGPRSVTVSTTPEGLSVSVTYDGSETAPTNAGSYAVVATVTDPNYTGSASDTLTVQKADQTITFGALGDKTYGDPPFDVSATASSGLDVGFSIASGPATISGSTVTITGAGTVTVRASQAGDANYNPAPDVDQPFTVNKADTATTLTSSQNPSVYGQSVTFTATVSVQSSGLGTPTGNVTFKDGLTTLGSQPLNGSGQVTFTTSALSVGSHSITAEYAGDGNFNESTSSTLTQTVRARVVWVGGVGAPPAPPPGTTDVRGMVSTAGVFLRSVTAISEDGLCTLTIPEGMVGLTEELEPLTEITILIMDEPPPAPEDAYVIGLVYDFQPSGATFEPPITLTFNYDPADIAEGIAEEDLVLAYYDQKAGEWVNLGGTVDTERNTITVLISHFTAFIILGYEVVPEPAAFTVGSLVISPTEVDIGETINVSLLVANTGGMAGSYEVTLKIDGVVEATQYVTVGAGESETVTFTTSRDVAGSYSVDINGLSGSFTVKENPAPPPPEVNWPVVGGIIAVVVVGLLIFFVIRRRAY
jgi:VCBS repeat-containing protein